MNDYEQQTRDLVMANRILAKEGVVDAFGHASIRHPTIRQQFILSYSRSPELVTVEDLGAFDLQGNDVSQSGRRAYAERYIHAGIYEARDDVNAVVHSHSHAVVPFSVSKVPLRPVFHVGATMGARIPVWDMRDRFQETNLLVVNMQQARDLAKTLGRETATLMRGHGCVVTGQNLRRAVISAVYMHINARLQMDALSLGEVTYLTPEEASLASESNLQPFVVDRLWECWKARIDSDLG
jgi:ribulose-5-phosphate 4-epimerase/fuculose-1-phosphate aldolase